METREWKLDADAFCIIGMRSKGGSVGAPHRLGAEWVDFLSKQERFGQFGIAFGPFQEKPELLAEMSEGRIGNAKAVLIKPTTTVNSIGECIRALKQKGLTADNLILVYDDCSIEPGRYKSMLGRSSSRVASHHGARAVETEMGMAFGRLKIGVGAIQGSADEFFGQQHKQAALIQGGFVNLLNALFSAPSARARCKSQDVLSELVQQWKKYWEDGGQTELRSRLDKLADENSISPHPVFVSRGVQQQAQSLWDFLLRVIKQADARYSVAIKKRENDDPIVQLLEQGVPRILLPAIRSSNLHLNHLRLDAHLAEYGNKPVLRVIELNAAPGGIVLDQFAGELFQGIPALDGLELATCSSAQPLLHYGLKPLLGNGRVALVGQAGSHTFGETGNPFMAGLLTDAGAKALMGLNCEQMEYDPRLGLHHQGERIDLIFALTNYGVEERANAIMSPAVIKAVEQGRVRIFPSPRNLLFASKGFLAALSNPTTRSILGVNEKQWQKRHKPHFPWCRVWNSETAETVEQMRQAGICFVRKPFFGSGGRGVEVLGPMAFYHESKKYDDHMAVVQLHIPPPALASAPHLRYDLLFPVYTGQSGELKAMPMQTRVFSGEKVNLASVGGGAGAVFLYDE